jgi:8-oxo-dGTP pyrophosphatase MutT (NUDIX family)
LKKTERQPKVMIEKNQKIPPLRPASTVILVRERQQKLQVYLLRRSAQSGFMGDKYVFPGGTLDPPDMETAFWEKHVDLQAEEVEQRLGGGLPKQDIFAYGVAAIRETLEEAGVFLAHRKDGSSAEYERIDSLRMAEDLSKHWFLDLIESENWVLQFSQLARWAQWITPKRMKYRYDTRFFLVFMPQEQECTPDARETVHGIWLSPEQGLAGNLSGNIPLSPPTVVSLHQLLAYQNLNDLKQEIRTRKWGDALEPNMVVTSAGAIILEPWDPEWSCETITVDKTYLMENMLPVGAPMSRIWLYEDLWRPVKV